MRQVNIKIANTILEVGFRYQRFYNMCKDFIVNDPSEITVQYTQRDIEKEIMGYEDYHDGNPSKIQMEVILLLKKTAEALIEKNVFLLHGAAIAVNSFAYIFSAPSGTGKTTHIKKWIEECSDAYIINGDKPFIKVDDENKCGYACGSPWSGKENLYTNSMIPLKSIILMERGENNIINQITINDAFPMIIQQIYKPEEEEKMRTTLRLVQKLFTTVSFWHFQCNNFKDDSFEVAYNGLINSRNAI